MSGQKNSGREDSRGGIFGKRKPKVAKNDFTGDNLPHSRRDVFRDVLKNRWKDLLKLGALLMLFSLPLLVFGAVGEINAANIYARYKNGAISAETYASEVAASNGAFALIKIIGYLIFSVGIAGSARVLRQIIWDEPLFFSEDFKDGIKIYGGQFALAMFLYGLCSYTAVFFSSAANGILYAIALGLGVFILLPAMFFWLSERTVYANRIGENIRNGFMFYVRTLFKSIGMLLLAFLPFILEYVLYRIRPSVLAAFLPKFFQIVQPPLYPKQTVRQLFLLFPKNKNLYAIFPEKARRLCTCRKPNKYIKATALFPKEGIKTCKSKDKNT